LPAVTAVLSKSIVSVWPLAVDVKPVPPAIVKLYESKSTAPVPLSPAKSRSSNVS
jgi:hypothetical protein